MWFRKTVNRCTLGRFSGILCCSPWMVASVPERSYGEVSRPTIAVRVTSSTSALTTVELRRDAWDDVRVAGARARMRGIPLPGLGSVDLELERFYVTRPDTRFVVGHKGGHDQVLRFDPSRFVLMRGRVIGYPGSHVVLTMSDVRSVGHVDLGPGARRFDLFGGPVTPADDLAASTQRLSITPARAGGPPPWVPACGLHLQDRGLEEVPTPISQSVVQIPLSAMRRVELAIETDYEFFELFGNTEAAAAYIVEMYAMVSAIYMRDVHTRVELSFVRIWDTSDDLFNDPSPLWPFRNYWNSNMGDVPRDAAQFVTGRRNLPYGGSAYLSSLCQSSGYSVAGYILGSLPDPQVPSVGQWDVNVVCHELGHTFGTMHTHDGYSPHIDDCAFGVLSRGTIMSYCHTLPGGNANLDQRFHTRVQQVMSTYIADQSCVIVDCNANSVDDLDDVLTGFSNDTNGNSIPDECEDCNGNGVLDGDDIVSATSSDLDGDGVPDECQPDCNGNGRPDGMDIVDNTSDDLYGDNIPDECALDCNSNNVSDYNEIVAHMEWDLNRNARLDACEDCNGDGITDAETLAGAHSLWVTSSSTGSVNTYHPGTGVLIRKSDPGVSESGQDLLIRGDGTVLVSSALDDRVLMFSPDGAFVGDLVASGVGGLDYPTGLVLSSSGHLLVSSAGNNSVLEYDVETGAFIGQFIAPDASGLSSPYGLTLGPSSHLFVCSVGNHRVYEFDGQSGAFIRFFVASGAGGLAEPRGLTFKPDGNLLVTSFGSDEVLEYDGANGQFIGRFDRGGLLSGFWALQDPWQIRVGPNGHIYVSSNVGNAGIHMYHGQTGVFLRSFYVLSGPDLTGPSGFDFAPGWSIDCNLNLIPDSCDIVDGLSADVDEDGVPDACTRDCNNNGQWDRLDLIPFGPSYDVNANGVPDECDACTDADGCGDGDNCTFDQCVDALCVNEFAAHGDVAGAGGSCGPDGVVDLLDITAILDAFRGVLRGGCTRASLDLTKPGDHCGRDGIIQLPDILAVLDAFQGADNCCP